MYVVLICETSTFNLSICHEAATGGQSPPCPALPPPVSDILGYKSTATNMHLIFCTFIRSEIGDSRVIVTSHHRNMQTPRPSAGEIINEPNYKAEQHLKVISTTKYLLLTAFKYFLMLKYFLRNVGNVCA